MQSLTQLRGLGTEALTITGGGDPLCFHSINSLITDAAEMGIEVGLITNGDLLESKLCEKSAARLTWCRISCSDEGNRLKRFEERIRSAPGVAWSLSYILTKALDYGNLIEHIRFVNRLGLSHIRVIYDMVDWAGAPSMAHVRDEMIVSMVDDSKVLYQERKTFTRGAKKCRMSLLKPFIGADGFIYPCCGIQYAKEGETLGFPASMRMGRIEDIHRTWVLQEWFNGLYFNEYNAALEMVSEPLAHEGFV
jgi:hypothetical protein